jgi:hypothetical protein
MRTEFIRPFEGEEYVNGTEAIKALKAGKDFITCKMKILCHIRDFTPGQMVVIRYDKTKYTFYIVKGDDHDGK